MTKGTKTVTVSCSLSQGRHRAGVFFAPGSNDYQLTPEQIKKVEADPALAIVTHEQKVAEAVSSVADLLSADALKAAFADMSVNDLDDLLDDVVEARNAKATQPSDRVKVVFERDVKSEAAKSTSGKPQGASSGKGAPQEPKGKDKPADAKTGGKAADKAQTAQRQDAPPAPADNAEAAKEGEGASDKPAAEQKAAEPEGYPEGLPHVGIFEREGVTYAQLKELYGAGNLATVNGLGPVYAGEVADFLDALKD